MAERIDDAGAGLRSLAEPWADTTSPAGRVVLTVFAGIAGFERALILARTGAGQRVAKARGVRLGRPPKLGSEQLVLARRMLDEGRSAREVAKLLQVHVATLYRALNVPTLASLPGADRRRTRPDAAPQPDA